MASDEINEARLEAVLRGLDDEPDLQLALDLAEARLFGSAPPPKIGRFEVLEVVGSGAMGIVYAARDPQTRRKVALKLLTAESKLGPSGPAARARLEREGWVAARLRHRAIVRVHERGVHEGQLFLVMDFIEGVPVNEWLLAAQPDWPSVLLLFMRAGEGLAAAHTAGYVHRDFKPANLLVDRRGRPHIVDLGLARPIPAARSLPHDSQGVSFEFSITAEGQVSGTLAYMAPELFAGARASVASDIYAYCVSLREALTGHGEPGARRYEDIPVSVFEVLARGLSPAPDARWPSMKAMLEALVGVNT